MAAENNADLSKFEEIGFVVFRERRRSEEPLKLCQTCLPKRVIREP